jgi:hypothetical protein
MLSPKEIAKRFSLDESSADFDAKAIDEIQLAGFEHGKAALSWDDACVAHAVDMDIEHTAQLLFVPEAKVRRVYNDAWREGAATRIPSGKTPARRQRAAARASA